MITLTELKALLRETGTSNDTYYNMIIPLVIESICQYCKNYFIPESLVYQKYICSESIFDSTAKTAEISDYDGEFVVGDYVRVFGTELNNYHALITTIAGNKLTLSQCDVRAETAEQACIYRVDYPSNLKLLVSNIIKFITVGTSGTNTTGIVKKEKIDDYEIEYFNGNLINGLPEQFLKGLTRYKKFYWDELNYD